ncbi:MAG: hypothetical protein H7843_09435 [Nitrospirota bacterium]
MMNTIRTKIELAIEALIREKSGFVFQRLAIQCLQDKYPSLVAVAEQADCGEDAVTVFFEGSDRVNRSLACSLTATLEKIKQDADKIISNRSDIQEIIFATPKEVTQKIQRQWEKIINIHYKMKLIVIDRAAFLNILEHPKSHWICNQYLNLNLGYLRQLKSAKDLRDSQMYDAALKNALDAERGALDYGDWETLCRAQLLLTQLFLDKGGFGAKNYPEMALTALTTARQYKLTSLLSECLIERVRSIMETNREEARELLNEAEGSAGSNLNIQEQLYLCQAELERSALNLDKAEEALAKCEGLVRNNKDADHQLIHHMRFRLEADRGNHATALEFLDMAIKLASSEKRPINVGYMLQDKAQVMARTGDLHKAALAADEARDVFEKLEVKRDAFESALIAGHFFFESKDAERALGLANHILSKLNPEQYENLYLEAIQLRTKSLQVLNKIEEAFESNKLFRTAIGHKPQALISADLQDAMLWAQIGKYEKAEELIKNSFERADKTHAQKEIISVIKIHWAQIKMSQANYLNAKKLAEEVLESSETLPTDLIKDAAIIVKIAENRAQLTVMYDDLMNHPELIKLAGISNRRTIQEAHAEIVRPLLEWSDIWPKASQEIYDFWGKTKFRQYILHHRNFKYSFHVTVEATTVEEARLWTRVLCPLVDVLTILWKGPTLNRISQVPVRSDYKDLVGWGYTATSSILQPERNYDDSQWFAAMGFATLLPKDAVEFLFHEARGFFESGSLFLLPAPNVGCVDRGHGPIEQMFNNVVNASPFLSQAGSNGRSLSFGSIPLPYFPDVPMNELAAMKNGEHNSLLETRICLKDWSETLCNQNNIETRDVMVRMHEKIDFEFRKLDEMYKKLSKKHDWAKQVGQVNSHSIESTKFKFTPPIDHIAGAAQLTELFNGLNLNSTPWYAYFRLNAQGYKWDLLQRNKTPYSECVITPSPEGVFHWLVPPMPGWLVRTLRT